MAGDRRQSYRIVDCGSEGEWVEDTGALMLLASSSRRAGRVFGQRTSEAWRAAGSFRQ